MRILLFAPNYLPATRYGGPIRSTHGLARGLVANGHKVTVLTTDVDGRERLDVPLDNPVELDGVRVHYCPITAPRRIYRSPALAKLAARLVPNMDAVHVNGMFLWPGPQIARVAKAAAVPLVISPRGMLMPEMVSGKSRLAKTAWIRLLERTNLAAARAIHVTSDIEADGLRQLGLDLSPVAVIANGVTGPAEPPTPAEITKVWGDVSPGRRVAFLARLDWTKGADMAIAAVRSIPGAVLRLAGPDQIGLRSELERGLLRDDGSLSGAFVGEVAGRQKWAFLAGADLLLVPSVAESFGMSVVEALAVGTPVVATEGVGAVSLLRRIDCGLVVPRRQSNLNAAVGTFLGDVQRRVQAGQRGRDLVIAEFSWPQIAARMAAVYAGSHDRAFALLSSDEQIAGQLAPGKSERHNG